MAAGGGGTVSGASLSSAGDWRAFQDPGSTRTIGYQRSVRVEPGREFWITMTSRNAVLLAYDKERSKKFYLRPGEPLKMQEGDWLLRVFLIPVPASLTALTTADHWVHFGASVTMTTPNVPFSIEETAWRPNSERRSVIAHFVWVTTATVAAGGSLAVTIWPRPSCASAISTFIPASRINVRKFMVAASAAGDYIDVSSIQIGSATWAQIIARDPITASGHVAIEPHMLAGDLKVDLNDVGTATPLATSEYMAIALKNVDGSARSFSGYIELEIEVDSPGRFESWLEDGAVVVP